MYGVASRAGRGASARGEAVKFDDNRVDVSGVRDRRGGRGGGLGGRRPSRGGIAVGGGRLGLVGLLVLVLVNVLGGGDGSGTSSGGLGGIDFGQVQTGTGTGETDEELEARCNTEGAIEQYDDCYLIKVYNEANEVWTDNFAARNAEYQPPYLGFFDGQVDTGCGPATSSVGPFYCPPDREIFIDLGFLAELQAQFGAEGRPAQAYIMAHEIGHHLQTITGVSEQVRAEQQRSPGAANDLSIALELQADCYAGVWGKLAGEMGNVTITQDELGQALAAAEAVGDDRIQQQTQGQVNPETWTHGSAEQRREWYERGYAAGDVATCNTFT